MSSRSVRRLSALSLVILLLAGPAAHAQYGMGGMGQPGGMPNQPMGQQPKDEGPAQQAPEEPNQPSDLEPLGGYTDQSRRRAQLLDLDGYFRMRTDYMHNFNLSQGYSHKPLVVIVPPTANNASYTTSTRAGLPPFPTPLSCELPANGTADPSPANYNCGDKDLAAASIRLRLEPTLNVTDQVRVRSQIDVLDNTIMGSTPDSLAGLNRPYGELVPQAPIPFLYTSQEAPEVGQNGYLSSIRAKRAWAEIDTEFGSLRFGRMPWHFGRGMSYNDGSCPDCTGGTTVDRIALISEAYGHQFTLALDYGPQGLTSNQLALGRYNSSGYPIDLAQDDDVFEYMFALTKIDDPIKLRERVDRGEMVVNYGLQLVYRSQQATFSEVACDPSASQNGQVLTVGCTVNPSTKEQSQKVKDINARLFQPSIWFKMHYRALTVEMEGTAVLGKMDHGGVLLAPDEGESRVGFRQFGGVLASELHLYRDAFFVGFETGGASGDQAEDPAQYLNYAWRSVRQPPGDHSIRDFKFSPEYHIDNILFRNILGTVTNAIYFKPAIAYWFDLQQNRQLGLTGSFVYSVAQVPVSTPGNDLSYGLEMDLGVNYRNSAEGFYAGMTWGVLWPMGALNRPATIGTDTLWGVDEMDAKAAQVLHGFLGVKF